MNETDPTPAMTDLSAALDQIEGRLPHETPREGLSRRERDALGMLAMVRAVLAVHVKHRDTHGKQPINGPWFCCGATQLGVREMDDCQECGERWPCATVQAATKAWGEQ